MKTPLIRPAIKEDLPGILEIWNHEIENSTSIFDDQPKSLSFLENWFEDRSGKDFPILVAEFDSKVVCYGSYGTFREKPGYNITVEHSIYAHPDYRAMGTGRLIMREMIRLAKDQKIENMIAVIDGSNHKSIRFHEKFGFIEAGRLERIAVKFGKHMDAVIMQLQLNRGA